MQQLKARAKINLFFHITGKRDDGYHLVESLVVFADDIYDCIAITTAEANSTKIVGGEFAGLIEGGNLIDKAVATFSDGQKYNCDLIKNIPVGAGLGGGSSDAAVVAKFLSNNASTADLMKIGVDLPVCYYDKPAFCQGIGEKITGLTDFPLLHMVLVNPRKTLLTADVFKINKVINTAAVIKPSGFDNCAGLIDFLSEQRNDLTEASVALMPQIETIITLMAQQANCQIARMSGSGPTCFGVFPDEDAAILAVQNISNLHPEFWVKYTKVQK